MKASAAIARFLDKHDIRHCFELVGGMITHLLDSLAESGRFTIISMHHEQAAAFAAEGVARGAGGARIGLAMGTSGPGAANLVTGIGSCWFDSVPCLFITGQVNVNEMKGTRSIRQQGFQELDIVGMVRGITKYAVQVNDVDRLLPELHRAVSLAQSGRKGPVLLDIPNNIQRVEIADAVVEEWVNKALDIDQDSPPPLSQESVSAIADLCRQSRKPLFCLGGGARWAPALDRFVEGLERAGIPYVSTLMGHERVHGGPCYFNMIGSYGNREANWAVQNCDLLVVLGARLDVRQTGADTADFARKARIIQVDIDGGQLNNRVRAELGVCADVQEVIDRLAIGSGTFPALDPSWLPELGKKRRAAEFDEYADWHVSPHGIFGLLNRSLGGQAVEYVCDVGNHQMWAAQGLRLQRDQAVHYSGGMGAMGFALPAAIGIALSTGRKTIVITGDGSLQVNSQELDTLHRLGLDVGIIVLNNYSLGMVKNFQDMYFNGRDQSTRKGYSCPDFTALAKAYGIDAITATTAAGVEEALRQMLSRQGPMLVEVQMPEATECRPRLAFGSKLDDQFPRREA